MDRHPSSPSLPAPRTDENGRLRPHFCNSWCGCRESAKRWGAYEASGGERGVIGEGEGEGGDEVGARARAHALGTGSGGIRTARYRAAVHGRDRNSKKNSNETGWANIDLLFPLNIQPV